MNSINDTLKTAVIKYCSTIGADPLLVQGAGGNVSWKEGDTLWVKASGTWLAEADERDIFVPVDLPHLRTAIESGDFSVTPRVFGDSELRPSIETLLHALMPHRVVVHLHAIGPLAHLVRYNSEFEITNKLKTEVPWAIVSYHKPGEALAKAVAVAIAEAPDTKILLLQNHGIVIGGSDIEEVDNVLTKLVSDLYVEPFSNANWTVMPKPILVSDTQHYFPINISDIHNLALNPDFFNRLEVDWALYPDHVVFLGSEPTCYDAIEFLTEDIKRGNSPELFFLRGQGVFSKSNFGVAKQVQLLCYYNVLSRQLKNTRLKVLDEQQIAELSNWDAERYRQLVAKRNIT